MKKKMLIVLAACLFMTGCGYEDILRSKGDKAIEHLEEKYGTEFTPFVYERADFMSSTDEVRYYAEGIDESCEYGLVYVSKENGKITYKDNYFAFTVREECEELVQSYFAEEFDEVKVFANNCKLLPEELKKGSTLEDALACGSRLFSSFRVYVGTDITQEEFRERCEAVRLKLIDKGIYSAYYIYQIGIGVTQELTRANYLDYIDYYGHGDGVPCIKRYSWSILEGRENEEGEFD